ncbi:hypothetical protein ITP53_11340 [Nonomuraea sp. K274]|uniref:Uncharacterized protein n=1 Tax=Nonomuraea cypriaca TaxID=1187855 RepID=A0A931ABK7_9ACTN|nr:hypothetical protein [Nonomuraea cypriaca]MBF8186332.1 hypothetical protein [Nonomuraea cypriaca]
MTTLYVVAGDPDRQLSPDMWREYLTALRRAIEKHATRIQGSWQSDPADAWPSVCLAVRVQLDALPGLRASLSSVRAFYGLPSIALAVADTHLFL